MLAFLEVNHKKLINYPLITDYSLDLLDYHFGIIFFWAELYWEVIYFIYLSLIYFIYLSLIQNLFYEVVGEVLINLDFLGSINYQ